MSCTGGERFGDIAIANDSHEVVKRNRSQVQPPLVGIACAIWIIYGIIDNEFRPLFKILDQLGSYYISGIHPDKIELRRLDRLENTGTNESFHTQGAGV